ncbi:putative pyruvate, phosphate dikinase [Helianthus anomalus]
MLQCLTGKRTGKGVMRIAVEIVNEGLIDTQTAIKRVETQHLDQLHPQVQSVGLQVSKWLKLAQVEMGHCLVWIETSWF